MALSSKYLATGSTLYQSLSSVLKGTQNFAVVREMHELCQQAVQRVDPEASLYLFGSTVAYGFHEKGSDVDFAVLSKADIESSTKPDVNSELHRAVQSDFLGKLSQSIQREHPTWPLDLVRRSRVPVLRVKGGALVDFDITAYRRNGVRNSALLRAYIEQYPLGRWLCMIVKKWSKQTGLNAACPVGCITSYGFNLMVIYFLLRRGMVTFVDPESLSLSTINVLPAELPLSPLTADEEKEELGKLALDFLDFYLHEFKTETHVITLNRGNEKTPKTALKWTNSGSEMGGKNYFLWCIEDPYELDLNVGRNVTPLKSTLLKKHMQRAMETAFLCNVPPPRSGK